MMQLEEIKSICSLRKQQLGGLRYVYITDGSNFNNLGQLSPNSPVYKIAFRPWSAKLSDKHGSTAGGDFYTKRVDLYIPLRRFNVEMMICELMDRKCVIFATDWNGEEYQILNAKFGSDFDTGSKLADSNGYSITFQGVDRKKKFLSVRTPATITGNSGITPGGDFGGGLTTGPGDPQPPADCCVTILTSPVTSVPPPTGNIINKNKFVTTIDGRKFFIDKNGLSTEFSNSSTQYHFIAGTGTESYSLPLLFVTSPGQLVIFRNGVVLLEDTTLSKVNTYKYVAASIILAMPLEADEYLQLYKF